LKIIDLPIPKSVKDILLNTGIINLYPPQEDAINSGVFDGKNLVLASPTASGKTLIAELCGLSHILYNKGKVLYLSPLRALANEKFEEFKKYTSIKKANGKQVRVGITTGDFDSVDSWLGKFDIIITTNEKADSLLRHRLDWIADVSLVIADEVHLLNDGNRGPTLEVVLARLMHVNPQLQVLALSATISNVKEISDWLKANHVTTDWRPVILKEATLLGQEILYKDGSVKKIQKTIHNPTINLAIASVKAGGQALIFASTRKSSVRLAKKLANPLNDLLSTPIKRTLNQEADKILRARERTKIGESLANLIAKGTAFHHAGLVNVHRQLIETLFREGKIKVITATPTLASGVNLPARTVIIHDYRRWTPGYGNFPISVLDYKQMAGRAGRPKYDKVGESILVSKTSDEADFLMENYLLSSPEKIWSKLAVEKVIRSHVLSTIASGYAHTVEGVYNFFERTFYAHQYAISTIKRIISKILQYLYDQEMLELYGDNIVATKFGRRVSELYIDPLSAVIIRDSIRQKLSELTNLSFLHLIMETPDMGPIMRPYSREIDALSTLVENHKNELFTEIPNPWDDNIAFQEFLGEFKTALILKNWIEEKSEDTLIEKFRIQPGDLFRTIENAKWLLHATSELSKLYGFKKMLSMASELNERVSKGIKSELLPLVKLEGIGRVRGRILYNKGYHTLNDIKLASFEDLKNLPSIGLRLTIKLKEQLGSPIPNNDLEKLTKRKEWKQESLSEY
jgi:helicase